MARFRIYIEETSSRLFYADVTAANKAEATAYAHAALDDDSWSDWNTSDTDASLEVLENLTERTPRRKAVR